MGAKDFFVRIGKKLADVVGLGAPKEYMLQTSAKVYGKAGEKIANVKTYVSSPSLAKEGHVWRSRVYVPTSDSPLGRMGVKDVVKKSSKGEPNEITSLVSINGKQRVLNHEQLRTFVGIMERGSSTRV